MLNTPIRSWNFVDRWNSTGGGRSGSERALGLDGSSSKNKNGDVSKSIMFNPDLYERPRAKFRKGTSWAIEPDRTYLELVFRWVDDGPQEETSVLELEWEPGL